MKSGFWWIISVPALLLLPLYVNSLQALFGKYIGNPAGSIGDWLNYYAQMVTLVITILFAFKVARDENKSRFEELRIRIDNDKGLEEERRFNEEKTIAHYLELLINDVLAAYRRINAEFYEHKERRVPYEEFLLVLDNLSDAENAKIDYISYCNEFLRCKQLLYMYRGIRPDKNDVASILKLYRLGNRSNVASIVGQAINDIEVFEKKISDQDSDNVLIAVSKVELWRDLVKNGGINHIVRELSIAIREINEKY